VGVNAGRYGKRSAARERVACCRRNKAEGSERRVWCGSGAWCVNAVVNGRF